MSDHLFISYSSVDGRDFALKLADELSAGPPPIPVWVDKRKLRPGEDWDEQIVEAIRTCAGLIFAMTTDSVDPGSVCKEEWVRALRYKKPVIPLRLSRDVEMPFRLGSREYIDFSGSLDTGLARLRKHLAWMESPEGTLQALKHRLADARRDLARAEPDQRQRIQDDIDELEQQIAQQQAVIANPKAAERRVQQAIDRGLERVRTPAEPMTGLTQTKFVNPPPLVAPTWFQNRHVETQLIGDFLQDDALRLMTVVGRGGIGKSALVCRLLRALEGGQLPDDRGPLAVDGIVYLSDARAFHRVTVPDLYDGLTSLVSDETRKRLDSIYKNPHATAREAMRAVLEAFPGGRTVVLLDNFEDAVDLETGRIKEEEIDEALRAVLELPPHGVKFIITTRVAPRELAFVEPARQRRLDLDAGLEFPYAENILRAMDVDGKVGLRNAPDSLLAEARERTRGYPRALEHLFGILSADRDTPLQELLARTRALLPERVVAVLVGEAFSRLDATAQKVMQALAIYRYPVQPAAVDYLLQPYVPGVDSAPVLSRLVNMMFIRRDAGRYYLHQIDRDHADSRLAQGSAADRRAEPPPFSRFALQHRAAEWFKLARTPRETWKMLSDVAAQLSEFELRCSGEDYNTAAAVFLEIDYEYLQMWGHYRLCIDMHARVEGRLSEPDLVQSMIGNQGNANFRMGKYEPAMACYQRALGLAREQGDRASEGTWIGNLAAAYRSLGQSDRAMEAATEALAIAREVNDRRGESQHLGNLASQYAEIGELSRAVDYYHEALPIDREVGDRLGEVLDLTNLGRRYVELARFDDAQRSFDRGLTIAREGGYKYGEVAALTDIGSLRHVEGRFEDAARVFKQAIELADDAGISKHQCDARLGLAWACLVQGDLETARSIAEAALQYDEPLTNHEVATALGMAALLQGDQPAARLAFASARAQQERLLSLTPRNYALLDVQGLALCGQAVCDRSHDLGAARKTFRTARGICSAPGVVARLLGLVDVLYKADREGALGDVRVVVAGDVGGVTTTR